MLEGCAGSPLKGSSCACVRGDGGSQDSAVHLQAALEGAGQPSAPRAWPALGIMETETLVESRLKKWSKNMARAGSLQCFAAVCVIGPCDFEDLNFSEEKKLLERFPPQVFSHK